MADAAAQALGAYVHHYMKNVDTGANYLGDRFSDAVAAAPGVIGDNVGGFVNGLITGNSPPAAKSVPAKAAASAAAPAKTAATPSAMDAFIAAQTARQSAPGYGEQATPTPLDIVRAAAMNNGGLSLNQLASLSESVARTVPQAVKPVPLTAKEQATAEYIDLVNKAANAAATPGSNWDKSPVGAATLSTLDRLRPVVGQPNLVNDALVAGQGLPPVGS